MACEKHLEACESLKMNAMELGFSSEYIADLLDRWGSEVLATVIELARNGLSTDFIVETLKKFGPFFLELFVDFINRKKSLGYGACEMSPCAAKEMNEVVFALMLEKGMPKLAEAFLPDLWEKLKPVLTELLTRLLLGGFKNR